MEKTHTPESRQKMRENQKQKMCYLSSEDIEVIKYKKFILKIPYKMLAIEYGVTDKVISKAARGAGPYSKIQQVTDRAKPKSNRLTEAELQDIRHKRLVLKMPYKEICSIYDRSYRTISDAVKGVGTYKLIPIRQSKEDK